VCLRIVAKCEFWSIANSDLGVNVAKEVSNNIDTDPDFLTNFTVLQSLGHQFNEAKLSVAELMGGAYLRSQKLSKLGR